MELTASAISVYFIYFKYFKAVHDYVSEYGKVFIFLGEGQHKIKRKAEQIACNEAIQKLDLYAGESA